MDISSQEIISKINENDDYIKILNIDSVDKIISLYKELGNSNYIGEEITQEEHAVQAALLAKEENGQEPVIIGALLHDIGHLLGLKYSLEMMDDLGCKFHEFVGSYLLSEIGFSKLVCDIVENHVKTKRYLVSKYPQYFDRLSEASKGTLVHQGGNMNENEIIQFEREENFEIYLQMRSWDERAKIKDMQIPRIEHFKDLLERNLFKDKELNITKSK